MYIKYTLSFIAAPWVNAKRRIKLRRDPSLDKGHRSKYVIIFEKLILRLILKGEGDSFPTVLKIFCEHLMYARIFFFHSSSENWKNYFESREERVDNWEETRWNRADTRDKTMVRKEVDKGGKQWKQLRAAPAGCARDV